MITLELISYIKKQILKNIPKNIIVSKLVVAGWHQEDINEAFLKIDNELQIQDTSVNKREIEIYNQELPAKKDLQDKTINTQKSKVWIPRTIPIRNEIQIDNKNLNNKIEKPVNNLEKQEDINTQEFIPSLRPKNIYNPLSVSSFENSQNINGVENKNEKIKDSLIKNLSQKAMLSSFPSDSLLVNQKEEKLIVPKKRKIYKSIIMILILLFITLAIWFFIDGSFNFSLIKKDPKVLILNNSKILASLDSYKSETKIKVTLPSISNINYALANNEIVPSVEKDYFLFNILGQINKNENNLASNISVNIKSSILNKDVILDINDDGNNLFVSSSVLNQVQNNPYFNPIKINKKQMNLIPPLFTGILKVEKLNFETLLNTGLGAFVDKEILLEYDKLINNTDIVDKGEAKIKDIDTNHYVINVDKTISKGLFSKIIDNFALNVSEVEKENLNLILDSSKINSFEVWIGKNNKNIYQYSIDFDIPLSKIIGVEDLNVGDNNINLKWEVTYFDFNNINNIIIPENSIPMIDFYNSFIESNLKNEIISFEQLASNFYKLESNYGKNSNINGNCLEPSLGSLFSSVGHSDKLKTEVNQISNFLNKTLNKTLNKDYCYSTSKGWSFTVPILIDYSKQTEEVKYYFCLDSLGTKTELINPPSGIICQ